MRCHQRHTPEHDNLVRAEAHRCVTMKNTLPGRGTIFISWTRLCWDRDVDSPVGNTHSLGSNQPSFRDWLHSQGVQGATRALKFILSEHDVSNLS